MLFSAFTGSQPDTLLGEDRMCKFAVFAEMVENPGF
jgi:hypothetical protein